MTLAACVLMIGLAIRVAYLGCATVDPGFEFLRGSSCNYSVDSNTRYYNIPESQGGSSSDGGDQGSSDGGGSSGSGGDGSSGGGGTPDGHRGRSHEGRGNSDGKGNGGN